MFSRFFKPPQLLDEPSIEWMFDTFEWALRNFDASVFFNETILVTPSNAHFPGSGSNAEGMASLIFDQVKQYAGMQHWPYRLVDASSIESIPSVRVQIEGPVRGAAGVLAKVDDESQKLVVAYHQEYLHAPEVLIADYAHTLAHYLGTTAAEPPPGGEGNWPHVTELLAVFLGFGVVMADSANTAKIRSCGSCSGPAIERANFLSEYDITYAMAIFCSLKAIPVRDAAPQLKSSLRPFFKKAMKDVARRKPPLLQISKEQPVA
ncbi:MAG: hypothetical protein COB30_007565 [Ectothiorhodospiraceae bacterium]|nr:hypothetical protein [Ectothiorhodospiraceae bacterium]